jgi:hypothetical protein
MSLGEARELEAVFPPPTSGPDTRRNGWRFEGIVGYMFETPVPGSIEIFRLYNSFNGGHLFTISAAERDFALSIVDQKTQIKPWSQHKSLGFAFFSDSTRGAGAPRSSTATSAPAVAAPAVAESPTTTTTTGTPQTHVASLIATVPSAAPPILATASAPPVALALPVGRNAVVPVNTDSLFADLDGLADSLLSSDLAG